MERNGELFSGSIGKRVIGFATPIILTNLIQAIYGIVDMITVGHFVGASGMSAVSMGAQITAVVLVIGSIRMSREHSQPKGCGVNYFREER